MRAGVFRKARIYLKNLSYFAVFCKPTQSPQLCVKLWRFFIDPKNTPGFPQLFSFTPVEKPVENVDNSCETIGNKKLRNVLCKL